MSLSIFWRSVVVSDKRRLETLRASLTTGWHNFKFSDKKERYFLLSVVSIGVRFQISLNSLTVMSLLSKSRLLKRFNFFSWSKFAECELSDGSNSRIFDNWKVMSRNHAVLHYREQRFFLEDTNSSNGTHVNDQRLQPYQVALKIYWFPGCPDLMGCHLVPKISWGQLFY